MIRYVAFFFFQAEDGIRDFHVTGVQTCALPILILISAGMFATAGAYAQTTPPAQNPPETTGETPMVAPPAAPSPQAPVEGENSRSEERRVGKECRYQCSTNQ